MSKTLIFTGAGMSVPLGLPSTRDFMGAVQKKIRPVTQRVIEYLGSTGEDIEWLLSTLVSFNNETPFTEFLLNHIAEDAHSRAGLPGMQRKLQLFKAEAVGEITRIKKIIFDKLSSYKPEDALSLYLSLMREVRATFPDTSLSLITTNYDLTFETAVELAQDRWRDIGIEDVDFGFSINFGRPIYNPSQDFQWSKETIEYIKVHGSVDWHRDAKGRCSRSMSNTVPDDPDQMAILYPGYKGVPEIEPFISMHGRLNQRLAEADQVVVIGFAFRDAYINNIYENIFRVRPDLRVWYFNPLSVDEFPDDSLVPHFIKNYSCFKHVQRGIKIEDEPLRLADLVKQ